MIRFIVLFSFLFVINLSAMHKQPLTTDIPKTNITVLMNGYEQTYSIDCATTVACLKTKMHAFVCASEDQQSIYPLIPEYFGFGCDERNGPLLDDSDNIKQVMSKYKINRFAVKVSLSKLAKYEKA